ncbi:MAG: hypothetical protein C0609_09415 [Deltaproteobacteria bacterium]|nr:MAG: hypothetical protein C0609_09415 [Deltaproteobacteria bacterium]
MCPSSGSYEERSQQTKRNILREAARLFARNGYHKTTIADISRAIGMTQGALFHKFPNKEAILYAVVSRLARGFDEYSASIKSDDATDPVGIVVKQMVSHYRKNPEDTICLAALASEFASSGHPILEDIRNAYDRFARPLAEVLAKCGVYKDPRSTAIAFIGAVQGIAIQGLLREEDPSLEKLAEAFLDMMKSSGKP